MQSGCQTYADRRTGERSMLQEKHNQRVKLMPEIPNGPLERRDIARLVEGSSNSICKNVKTGDPGRAGRPNLGYRKGDRPPGR